MTEDEIRARLTEAQGEIGNGDVSVTIKATEVYCYIHKGRYSEPGEITIFGRGEGADAAIGDALAKYAAIKANADRSLTERMALAVIRISHAFGSCSRSQLNQEFGPIDVARLSEAAAALASDMAAGGPFSVIDDALNPNSEAS